MAETVDYTRYFGDGLKNLPHYDQLFPAPGPVMKELYDFLGSANPGVESDDAGFIVKKMASNGKLQESVYKGIKYDDQTYVLSEVILPAGRGQSIVKLKPAIEVKFSQIAGTSPAEYSDVPTPEWRKKLNLIEHLPVKDGAIDCSNLDAQLRALEASLKHAHPAIKHDPHAVVSALGQHQAPASPTQKKPAPNIAENRSQ